MSNTVQNTNRASMPGSMEPDALHDAPAANAQPAAPQAQVATTAASTTTPGDFSPPPQNNHVAGGSNPATLPAPSVMVDPFGPLETADFAVKIGSQVNKMMEDATALLKAKDEKGNPDQASILLAQHMMDQAKSIQEMASKILQIMSDMQKTVISNMR